MKEDSSGMLNWFSSAPQSDSVLITGASTGIGAACAIALDKVGYRVFAGVRNQADGERLLGRENGDGAAS